MALEETIKKRRAESCMSGVTRSKRTKSTSAAPQMEHRRMLLPLAESLLSLRTLGTVRGSVL